MEEERLLTSYKKHEYTAQQVFARAKSADNIKGFVEDDYREGAKYFMPDRRVFPQTDNDFSDQSEGVNTALGKNCAFEYVNNIQAMLAPVQGDFLDLEAGKMYEQVAKQFGIDKDKLNDELAKVNMYANEVKNNLTNFDIAMAESLYDLGLGTSCLLITKGNRKRPIAIKAIPIDQYSILEGVDGEVSDVFRRYEKTAKEINELWDLDMPIEDGENGQERKIKLLECAYLDTEELDYVYSVYIEESKRQVVTSRHAENPFQVARWNKQAGETWGKGVFLLALEDMRSYNAMVTSTIRAVAFEEPMFITNSGGAFDVDEIELEGGAIIDIPATDSGDKGLEQLRVDATQPNLRINLQELEISIRKTCLSDSFPESAMNQQKTATEVMEITKSLAKNQSSVFGRMIRYSQGIVRRFYGVMTEAGMLNNRETLEPLIDAEKINGLWFACSTNTPLTKQLAMSDVQSMVTGMSMLLQLDPSGQKLNATVKVDQSCNRILDKVGYPIDLLFTPEEIAQNSEIQAEQEQQMQMQERQGNVMEANAIEKGKQQL